MSRSTTDRLLDGGAGPEPLRRLLAAAAAPAQAGELDGEQAARLAFTTSAGFPPLPDAAAHTTPRRNRALSWTVAAKAVVAVALTAGAGGVAVAATSHSSPFGPPDESTHRQSEPDSPAGRPAVVLDQAHGTTRQNDVEPTQESSPESAGSAHRGRTGSGDAPPAGPEQDAAPGHNTSTAGPTVAPDTPRHGTGPKDGKKTSTSTASSPTTRPGQQQDKGKDGDEAAAKKDHPGNSDHVDDPRSDKADQQHRAGQK